MKKINTDKAPAAIGPYVQAVDVNGFLFTSGQIPIDPATGEIVSDDIVSQTRQVLSNIKAIADAASVEINQIVKMTVFIKDMNQFSQINAEYEKFFLDNHSGFPARSCVEVARLPKDVKIEIEAIFHK